MNGLDIFSGIGGLTKALEGYVTPVAYCENDRYAQAVILSRMGRGDLPVAPIWDDIKTLKASDIEGPVEIVYGGPPCQPWSSAGKRIGKSDERNMWPEALRIVEEFKPGHCFFENVDELATDPYLIEIVEHLETLGYFVPWPLILAASDVGAPHQRERLWIIAHLAGQSMGASGQSRKPQGVEDADIKSVGRSKGRSEPKRIKRRHGVVPSHLQDANPHTAGLPLFQGFDTPPKSHGWPQSDWGHWWDVEPDVGRVVHGLSFRMDRIKCLGNAVVPAQAREAFERLLGLK